MAFGASFTALIILLITISSTATMSSAALIGGGILGGVLTCTNTSVSVAGTFPVIPQTRVDLVCGSGSLAHVVKSAVTDTSGVYSFAFTTADSVLNDPGSCYLSVTVPATTCFINAPTGVLRIPILVLSQIDAVVGQVLILIPGAISYVLGV